MNCIGPILITFCIAAVIAPSLGAAPVRTVLTEETKTGASPIPRLLSELSADPWQRRVRAQDELVDLGEEALAWVERFVAQTSDEEARSRAEHVLARIRVNMDAGPTLVSLDLTQVTPAEAFEALARQSKLAKGFRLPAQPRMPIVPGVPNWRRPPLDDALTLKIDRAPFWSAFRDLCAQTGYELAHADPDGTLFLTPGASAWAMQKASISGPFMVSCTRIDRGASRGIIVPPGGGRGQYTLRLLAFAEPRLKPLSWSIVSIGECVGENGGSLVAMVPQGGAMTANVNTASESRLHLLGPAQPSRRIERLELTARFLMEVESESLEIEDVASAVGEMRSVGKVRFLIKRFEALEGGRYGYTFAVARGTLSAEEWGTMTHMMQRFMPRVLDAQGKPLTSYNISVASTPTEFTRTCDLHTSFGGGEPTGPPARLVWTFPTETRQLQATFRFTDLQLP